VAVAEVVVEEELVISAASMMLVWTIEAVTGGGKDECAWCQLSMRSRMSLPGARWGDTRTPFGKHIWFV
jgi:hypothetical protein